MIDIFIASYLRPHYTKETLRYLRERTKYPYRVFLIDQGGNEEFRNEVDYYIQIRPTTNVHTAWNIALSMAESEYFITSDPDIYVPELSYPVQGAVKPDSLRGDWLEIMVRYMDEKPEFAAISLHPHVLIGAASFDPDDPEDVKEVNMAGAVMRIMRTEVVRKVGGWEHKLEKGRNHEERTISSRLIDNGYKVGRTTRIRAYHPFGLGIGGNWGYGDLTPEEHGHNPDLKEYVESFDRPDNYNQKTWLPK